MAIPLQHPMLPSPPCLRRFGLNLLVTNRSSTAHSFCGGSGHGYRRRSSFHQLEYRDPRDSPLAASLAVLEPSANGVVPPALAYQKKNAAVRTSTRKAWKETADSLQWIWQQELLCSRLHMLWSTSWVSHVVSARSREAGQSEALEISPQDVIEEFSVMVETSINEKLNIRQHHGGKTGFVTFLREDIQPLEQITLKMPSPTNRWWNKLLWLVGPTVLISSVVLPPVYLRKFFELGHADSLITDFLILFFTEGFFYVGVAILLVIAHNIRQFRGFRWGTEGDFDLVYKVSSIITMTVGVLLPIVTFAMVWPWTGPATAAALVPYITGLAVQFSFEQFVRQRKSPVWPLIPVVFQIYRLHQLNRATQLVAGLVFSLRAAEVTAETLAVNGSLQTLLSILQLLGVLCLWSLAAFLTHAFPSRSHSHDHSGVPSPEA